MKPLAELRKTEKARLLHQLFPLEIPRFLLYVQGVAQQVGIEQVIKKEDWKDKPISYGEWIKLATDTFARTSRYKKQLHKSSKLFADQLFDGNNTFFMEYCLKLYTTIHQSLDKKFNLAVTLLFG